ncbi:hypothetical protein GJ496_006223 [Pomphorhynchus laevis]|nr:hypothetical protein GJ496_006223 [Pomphorhynchus laevis]
MITNECENSPCQDIFKSWNCSELCKSLDADFLREIKIYYTNNQLIVIENPKRFTNRRKPAEFKSIDEPCDPNLFNFMKIKKSEVLLTVDKHGYTNNCITFPSDNTGESVIAYNAAPILFKHCIIIPQITRMHNQTIDQGGLQVALQFLLRHRNCRHRPLMIFNSTLAHASVNHQHFHFVYLNQDDNNLNIIPFIFNEDIYNKKAGWIYNRNYGHIMLINEQQLYDGEEFNVLISQIEKICDRLKLQTLSYNMAAIIIQKNHDRYLRCFIWPRIPLLGQKLDDSSRIPIAALELCGIIVVRAFKAFDETKLFQQTKEETTQVSDILTKTIPDLLENI